MEIELKYRIENKEQREQIWEDSTLLAMEEPGSRDILAMSAAYFDTEDLVLSKHEIALRTRQEGTRYVGTLKRRDNDVDEKSGLYVREELNVPLPSEASFFSPDPTIFVESEEGKKLMAILAGKPLVCIFETVFTRWKLRIDSGLCICEISLDEGEIIAGENRAPISEFEIELYSGPQEEMFKIGESLKEKYNLFPESRSKYARGRALAYK
ncbi:MAG: CYTH domain-containing protein [Clostridiales Family XIII bacterium]|jgi:inorganic triphosphatase YgiF|nr:CYTH domain-containing protein [Clostridiales Family XIII bacterium]